MSTRLAPFIVLMAGVFTAFIIAALFVIQFSPSSSYRVENVLLEPSVLKDLNYNDLNPKTSENDRFIFDAIWIEEGAERFKIDLERYQKVYDLLKGDKSLETVPDAGTFDSPSIRITIKVKTESPSAWQKDSKDFQWIEFSKDGSHYRVLLHEDRGASAGSPYANFYQKDILNQVKKLLKP